MRIYFYFHVGLVTRIFITLMFGFVIGCTTSLFFKHVQTRFCPLSEGTHFFQEELNGNTYIIGGVSEKFNDEADIFNVPPSYRGCSTIISNEI